jgi:cytoskeletal protein CcmA (bactofilin family)
MGFFKDLEEDLSQVVEEMEPGDEEMEDLPEYEEDEGEDEDDEAELSALEPDEEEEVETEEEEVEEVEEKDYNPADEQLSIALEETVGNEEETNTTKEGEKEMSEEAIYVATAEAETMKTDLSGKNPSDETASITSGMTIAGNISSEGSLDLQGNVQGNIDVLGKLNITGSIDGDSKAAEIFADNAKITGEVRSKGSVKIGQSTVIIGNIFANSAVIAGAVKGDIDIQGPVILDTSAIVMGNIKSKSVQINNGAVIEGMCSQCYAEINPTSFFDEMKKSKKEK